MVQRGYAGSVTPQLLIMEFTTTDLLALLSSLALLLYYRHSRATKRYRLPPGPPGLPLIGNLLDMPKEQPCVKYLEWAQQYRGCQNSPCLDRYKHPYFIGN